MTLLAIRNLTLAIGCRRILGKIDWSMAEGDRCLLIGESGGGKTMLARCMIGLPPRHAEVKGSVVWRGRERPASKRSAFRSLRGKRIAYMVQHPHSALDPVRRVGDEAVETVRVHRPALSRRQARNLVLDWFVRLGFRDPERIYRSYPFQLSGGMAARVYLAICLALDPELLVADEPTAGLDVLTTRRIMAEIKAHLAGRALLLISHDPELARGLVDRVAVLGAGTIREWGSAEMVLETPLHPYSRWLTSKEVHEWSMSGVQLTAGEEEGLCPYRWTCPERMPVCDVSPAPKIVVGEGGVRCHRYSE